MIEITRPSPTARSRRPRIYVLLGLLIALSACRVAPEDAGLAVTIERLSKKISLLADAENYDEAIPLAEALVANQKKLFGGDAIEVADGLNVLGFLLSKSGKARDAISHHQEALKIIEKDSGPEELTLGTVGFLGFAWWQFGEPALAAPHLKQAVELSRVVHGAGHSETARHLGDLGRVLNELNDAAGALQAFEQALQIVESLDSRHPDRSRYLSGAGSALKAQGDYDRARDFFKRALEATIQVQGPEHPDTATDHGNLGTVLELLGELEQAEQHYERALALDRQHHGDQHPSTATSLSNLGSVRERQGEYAEARRLFEEALLILETHFGLNHPETAIPLTNLGHLLKATGDLRGARQLYERALAIREAELGPKHPKTATSLNNLASVVEAFGDLSRARQLHEQALSIRREVLGLEHPSTAISLNNLGLIAAAMGDPMLGVKHLTEALAIREKVYPPDHPEIATNIGNLGSLFRFIGDLDSVRIYSERALAMRLRTLGPDHPTTAHSHHNLGMTLLQTGGLKGSRLHLERSVAIRESVLGADHPDTIESLLSLATLERESGHLERALLLTRRLMDSHEKRLAPLLMAGSDAEKRLLLRTQRGIADWTLTLHLRSSPSRRDAARLALTMILREKGRAFEETLGGQQRLREAWTPENAALWEKLKALREEQVVWKLRRATSTDPEKQAKLAELDVEARKLEAEFAERSAAYRQTTAPVRVEAVQAALPSRTALVELLVFNPLDVRKAPNPWGEERYAAYVLRASGEPAAVDLGTARELDEATNAFRRALAERRPDVHEWARKLDALTMERIRPLLGDATRLVLSPDGELNLVPFAALIDSQGEYLIEQYTLSYVTSGRDLLREAVVVDEVGPPLVVGGPDFEAVPSSWQGSPGAADRDDPMPASFGELPGAAAEAVALGQVLGLPDGRVLTGPAATEAAVKSAEKPRILHLATHGFFLPGLPVSSAKDPFPDLLLERAGETRQDALLQSALAFAGFNHRQRSQGADDGVLTALEVLGLDLWGTELVTLSACETGIGEVRAGRGVFGLRRAFALAGARSQMMSLWQVTDDATTNLMVSWYTQLQEGVPGDEALRKIQLAALRGEGLPRTEVPLVRGVRPLVDSEPASSRHPYYWASYVFVGSQ